MTPWKRPTQQVPVAVDGVDIPLDLVRALGLPDLVRDDGAAWIVRRLESLGWLRVDLTTGSWDVVEGRHAEVSGQGIESLVATLRRMGVQ